MTTCLVPRILRSEAVLGLAVRATSIHTQTITPKYFPLVVLGGGSGGCSMAARACRLLGPGNVAVVDPAQLHLYQPMFTMVGAGITPIRHAEKPMSAVLPSECAHIQHRVEEFDPAANQITLSNGQVLKYRFLVIALGIQLNYNKVDGLLEALRWDRLVCSNYSRETVVKTFPAIQSFKKGIALFTYPSTPVKCAGAAQKVMYLADDYWRKSGVRDNIDITFKTSIGALFLVKKYANRLEKIVQEKGIHVDYKRCLVGIDHTKKEATFKKMDSDTGETEKCQYDFIHVTPPMSGPDVLKNSKSPIVDDSGFLDINKYNLQHTKFPNIFGVGDCTNLPTSKTVAAISGQSKVLLKTLKEVMDNVEPTGKYDGYTSCPLVTSYNQCILAEFDYDGQPLETFHYDQSKESRAAFQMKRHIMPELYWKGLVNGIWNGPKTFRKLIRLWMSK